MREIFFVRFIWNEKFGLCFAKPTIEVDTEEKSYLAKCANNEMWQLQVIVVRNNAKHTLTSTHTHDTFIPNVKQFLHIAISYSSLSRRDAIVIIKGNSYDDNKWY